ncbi:ArsR/SmtB family transcription factor [Actinoplanes awajinensis]|uniref:ArsR family transcriptional regulator n=1 Tax=Actinoplanes awajinensis subsp. mycoplanecinus TaxID=135947 RepID=A0A117MLL5_9ACTN|nr:winged helix-turn-helix domain-containing protein [Actinoplanes awajinensis]KUL24132.1 ArsR family transcriptional regulator [Actinoplanes awajinensis subsp. mycoplanecinus]
MGVWIVGADVLAAGRFAVSPLTETVAAMKAFAGKGTHPAQRAWLEAWAPVYRQRLRDDPFTAALVEATLRPRWVADFLVTPPVDADGTFDGDLARLRATTPDDARAQLRAEGVPVPDILGGPDLIDRTADVLTWVWDLAVRPDWPHRRRLLQADIVARSHQLATGGWAAALLGMRPDMHWAGDGRLQVNAYDHPPVDLTGAQLSFVPTLSRDGWICLDAPHRYVVVYPCAGFLADPAVVVAPAALSRLLGPVRALVLAHLNTSKTPTQLCAVTGYGLGTVGGHLRVLLDAGLVQRRRTGRAVLYYRTPRGEDLGTEG